MTYLTLKPSQIIISLMENFSSLTGYGLERVGNGLSPNESGSVATTDQVLLLTLDSLKEYPADKWLALCDALEPSPILVSAASYCAGFTWNSLERGIKRLTEVGEPLSDAYLAGQYLNPDAFKLLGEDGISQFSQLAESHLPMPTVKYLMAGLDILEYDVSEKLLETLNPSIAKLVAWNWARCGVPDDYEATLKRWLSVYNKNSDLCFWCQFAIDLRTKQQQVNISNLSSLAQSQTQRMLVSYFAEAIRQGPFKKEEIIYLFDNIQAGGTSVLWQRFLRLAYWLPHQAPLVITASPSRQYEMDIHSLKQHIEDLLQNEII